MIGLAVRLWRHINEPRTISVTHALVYAVLTAVALYSLVVPPTTVEGAVGTFSMRLLAATLAVGGALGVPTALAGIWWLERTAVTLVILSSAVYLAIILSLQVTGDPSSNRLLQAGFVFGMGALHFVRWHRVKQRPYDPDRVTSTPTD
ncbi:hypothetical protein SAMN05216184_10490 [Georgenia satyanarayanai]|uniref:Uncharacterized protein n=1 Tax=Georgenia satyanarayanai TaxID=860221 RepID=A0A2Y9A8R3_9MICO|nr:hypothetical protein [Georgenia satyanarayanai]PYG00151.1 hypothetical protein A8987_10490 [Georgenia satyanarayanai]SSA40356.1 hypothetical protein SAMN05216184_10490 [Georgenia satyanarayanai]